MKFSQELAIALSNSTEQFPVEFDDAWKWLGYSRKSDAKEALEASFNNGSDFCGISRKNGGRGRPSLQIKLTIDCFKSLGMMAGTEQGREVRQYFLKCERIAKEAVEVIPVQNERLRELEQEIYLLQIKEKLLATSGAILTMHGAPMLAMILGQPDAIVTRTEVVERVVQVDESGKVIASFEGVGIGELARRYGFGKGTKANDACRAWLQSCGIKDEQWQEQPTLINHPKLPRDVLGFLDRQWKQSSDRQLLIGEEGVSLS